MEKTTPQARALYEALQKRGIHCKLEAYDGYKHIDISIPWAKIDIEIDGLQHYLDPEQLMSDFDRARLSAQNDDFDTMHIPNIIVEQHLERIADTIAIVAREWYEAINKPWYMKIKKWFEKFNMS